MYNGDKHKSRSEWKSFGKICVCMNAFIICPREKKKKRKKVSSARTSGNWDIPWTLKDEYPQLSIHR